MNNIKLYDSYRGLAAIVVFLSHLFATFVLPYSGTAGVLPALSTLSATWAVNLFFILSGYLITYSILNNISSNGYFKWNDFLIARVARIYPPLIASIMMCVIIYWIIVLFDMHGKFSYRLSTDLFVIRDKYALQYNEILESLLMKGGLLSINGPLWSLYVEVKMYVIAMLIATIIAGRINIISKIIFFCLILFLIIKLSGSLEYVLIWRWGAIFAILSSVKPKIPIIMQIIIYFCMVVILLYNAHGVSYLMQDNHSTNGLLSRAALSFLVAAAILQGQLGAWLSVFSSTAKYSYTLYVIHFPMLLFFFTLTHQHLSLFFNYKLLFAICGFVFIVIIWSSYIIAVYFENKKRFEYLIRSLIAFIQGLSLADRNKL